MKERKHNSCSACHIGQGKWGELLLVISVTFSFISLSPNPLNPLVEEVVQELSFCLVAQVSGEPPATECHHHPRPLQPLHPGTPADPHGRCSDNGTHP